MLEKPKAAIKNKESKDIDKKNQKSNKPKKAKQSEAQHKIT